MYANYLADSEDLLFAALFTRKRLDSEMDPLVPLEIVVPVEALHALVALERALAQRGPTSANHLGSIVRHDLAVGADHQYAGGVPRRRR